MSWKLVVAVGISNINMVIAVWSKHLFKSDDYL